MEVMLEIYRTVKALGMEWKEKTDLGGLGASALLKEKRGFDRAKIERARELDGYVDLRAASAIYFIETRARVQDVVVRGPRWIIGRSTSGILTLTWSRAGRRF